jgi:dTDP-4-amino-4,6-dideoxygalactose transaminase
MDNLQAAFARSQLRRLDETVAHRQSNCEHLAARLREVPGIEVMPVPEYTMHD